MQPAPNHQRPIIKLLLLLFVSLFLLGPITAPCADIIVFFLFVLEMLVAFVHGVLCDWG